MRISQQFLDLQKIVHVVEELRQLANLTTRHKQTDILLSHVIDFFRYEVQTYAIEAFEAPYTTPFNTVAFDFSFLLPPSDTDVISPQSRFNAWTFSLEENQYLVARHH